MLYSASADQTLSSMFLVLPIPPRLQLALIPRRCAAIASNPKIAELHLIQQRSQELLALYLSTLFYHMWTCHLGLGLDSRASPSCIHACMQATSLPPQASLPTARARARDECASWERKNERREGGRGPNLLHQIPCRSFAVPWMLRARMLDRSVRPERNMRHFLRVDAWSIQVRNGALD